MAGNNSLVVGRFVGMMSFSVKEITEQAKLKLFAGGKIPKGDKKKGRQG